MADLPSGSPSRRGSGNWTLASGQTLTVHTRSNIDEELPHATTKTIDGHLRKYEALFALTAPRLRKIVAAFEDALHLGLERTGQVVVRTLPNLCYPSNGFYF
jgi:hexokinase